MSLENLLAARDIAIKTYKDALTSSDNDMSHMDSDAAEPIIQKLTALKKAAIDAATSYSEELDKSAASDNEKIQARDIMRNLSTAGGRRRSSTPRKASSSRRRRSTKRRATSHKQQKRRRGSRRAH